MYELFPNTHQTLQNFHQLTLKLRAIALAVHDAAEKSKIIAREIIFIFNTINDI